MFLIVIMGFGVEEGNETRMEDYAGQNLMNGVGLCTD